MAERRFELALQWIEENPDVPRRVANKIQNLYEGFAKASTSLSKLGFTGEQNEAVFKGLQAQYRANVVEATKGDIGFKLLSDTLDAQEKQAEATRKSWERFGRHLRNTGVRLGWLGYRMTIVGRMMLRWMTEPIKRIMGLLKNWDRTLGDTAYTLGLLQWAGMGSATTLASLKDILTKLPTVALKFNAALGALEAVWAKIAVDVGPILTNVLMTLADAFFELWDKVSPTLIPALQQLVDSILPPLLDLLKEAGPTLIEGFVKGLSFTIPLLINFLDSIKPILPAVATLIGAVLPLAPLFIAIGTAAYLLSPVLMALGSVITFLAGTALAPLIPILAAVAAGVTVMAAVFFWLKDAIGPIPALIAAVVSGLLVGYGVFQAVTWVIHALGAAGAAAAPGIAALGGAIGAAGTAASPAIPVILSLGAAVLMAGAGFLLAGAGVMLAVDSIIKLAGSLGTLIPLIPVLSGVAVGMLGIAAAGLAMLPAVAGVFAMSGALLALSASVSALAAAFVALTAALTAYKAVADVAKGITDALSGAVNWLGGALSSLCFKHAIPMAEAYTETLVESAKQTQELQEDVESLGGSLRRLKPGEVGVAGGAGEGGTQYITVYPSITIGSITPPYGPEDVIDMVSKGIAEALRRRG